MRADTEILVTLTESLWWELCRRAALLDVPVEWLVAGLFCDTLDAAGRETP